jgi:8-oxo-dGTP pyrophosphatase MutT (NUDIX family)
MPLRQHLLGLLTAYTPLDAREAGMHERLTRFVSAEPRCLEADFPPGHITASAWVLSDEAPRRALLTHHRKLGRWFQLGGHLEPGETVVAAALREAREESGLEAVRLHEGERIFDVDIHPIPARGATGEHLHYDVRFLLRAGAGVPLVASSESRSLAWVEMGRVAEYNPDESILRMVRKSSSYGSTSG